MRIPESHDAKPGEERFQVDLLVGNLAFFYEKLRNAIDFKEEHLLRKNAIERFLRRRLVIEHNKKNLGHELIDELIRGRYLPNNKLPMALSERVDRVVDRYLAVFDQLTGQTSWGERFDLRDWMLSIAATEVEQLLAPPVKSDALVEYVFGQVNGVVEIAGNYPKVEKELQLYLAIHRSLIRSDEAILRYHLFTFFVPDWIERDPSTAKMIVGQIRELKMRVEHNINHPLTDPLHRRMKRYATYFLILRDILEKYGDNTRQIFEDPDKLTIAVSEASRERYQRVRSRVGRIIVRSIIYLFLTKFVLAFLIELPYDLFFLSEIRWTPLIVNAIFHPTLLFLIGILISIPGKKNTAKILSGLRGLLYPADQNVIQNELHLPIRRFSPLANRFFLGFYTILFILSFGLVGSGLMRLGFNWVSGVLFLFFLSLVSFFGMKVRAEVEELYVTKRRENIFSLLLNLFALPVVQVGHWLSKKIPRFNILTFILDFVIEAPFKTLVKVLEEWFAFIKEKREEIS
ncbi:MAG: hypothetical protein WCV86_02710 [Patescibacteria group bacterium]